jgi:hypothetical protein
MATCKIYLNSISSEIKDMYSLVIELCYHGTSTQICTPYYLSDKNFDSFLERAVVNPESDLSEKTVAEINMYLSCEVKKLKKIINHLDSVKSDYTVLNILENYHDNKFDDIFVNYVDELVLDRSIQRRKLDIYKALKNQMLSFHGCRQPLHFCDISHNWLTNFRIYLSYLGYSEGALNSYFRVLHRICITARKDGVYTVTPDPFLSGYSESVPSEMKLFNDESLKKIKEADLSANPDLSFSRDVFLFSYLTNKMSFKDMANLKKSDLNDGMIKYYRNQKAKTAFNIRITQELQDLMNKYKNDGEYVFPILDNPGIDLHDQYRMRLRRYNSQLKELASVLGISCSLSSCKALEKSDKVSAVKNVKISISMGGKEKAVNLLCPLTGDIKQYVLIALEQFIGDNALAV